ncbi:CRISPR-associated endoribonuclease Cas6 [Actinoalloteichus hoggarensis]|uniref:Uncharacterized protein n=1 Tax=Actinoalloteichus hoggarensis TaxID=1470176 RepID=A0A221W6I9_9PSEU|nr:CRISPR-associated endoribonuclease Cas6 [Actinoalloteichus hoggarensis]ASO21580.1 hypothetical protein AHOG_19810 [Actinoalloteichus hoggarensis]MBB5922172.1 CRISPR-associated endoribonuclease Cas6 [Actinoalloteichus hoggarensis]
MRLRVEVTTAAREIPWRDVLRPGRGIVYEILSEFAPELGARLHESGWGPYRMVPVGHSAPRFSGAARRRDRGRYVTGGPGVVEFSSPIPEVVEALTAGLSQARVLDWGGTALRVSGVTAVEPPEFSAGTARMASVTPVVVKGPPAGDDAGGRVRAQRWLLPGEAEWEVFFLRNLRRKAESLGLDPEVGLTEVWRVGPKRSFAVGDGKKVGAEVGVTLAGAPETLRAVSSWGLGVANLAGFGSVAS